jgi:microsomal epoxide hydrolase
MFDRIGEKFLEWSDTDPSVEEILRAVSLYWLTDTFPRSIWPYRAVSTPTLGLPFLQLTSSPVRRTHC